jgi:hypothetical protein
MYKLLVMTIQSKAAVANVLVTNKSNQQVAQTARQLQLKSRMPMHTLPLLPHPLTVFPERAGRYTQNTSGRQEGDRFDLFLFPHTEWTKRIIMADASSSSTIPNDHHSVSLAGISPDKAGEAAKPKIKYVLCIFRLCYALG